MIKWFWTNINFRAWTFEGRKLANPILIIWRLLMIVPMYTLAGILCILLLSMFRSDVAADIWDSVRI